MTTEDSMFSKVDCALFSFTAGMLVTHWMATQKLNMMKERLEEQEKKTEHAEKELATETARAEHAEIELATETARAEHAEIELATETARAEHAEKERDTLAYELRAFKARRAIKEKQRRVPVARQELAEAAAKALIEQAAAKARLCD